MANPDVSAHLKFLNNSAHLLATAAPEVSRHLMSTHSSLLLQSKVGVTGLQRESCLACGTIMIPGWEGNLDLESKSRGARRGKKRTNEGASKTPKGMIYSCDSCHSQTRFPIDTSSKPPRYRGNSTRLDSKNVKPPAVPVPEHSKETASVISSGIKKRSKSKKQSGLGALLAKQKESQSGNGFGFDLMDFMKKS